MATIRSSGTKRVKAPTVAPHTPSKSERKWEAMKAENPEFRPGANVAKRTTRRSRHNRGLR